MPIAWGLFKRCVRLKGVFQCPLKPCRLWQAPGKALLAVGLLGAWGCASLHHVQISDIEISGGETRPVEVKISETGIDIKQAANMTTDLTPVRQAHFEAREVGTLLSLFEWGPRTGNRVYSEIYADQVVHELVRQCPSGRITGIVSIRESRDYSIVSGEVVKLSGLCVTPKLSESQP